MSFFQLRTPRDMLDKAHREHDRLAASFDIDNVFNFFITASHIRDYVRDAVSKLALDEFLKDPDISDARDLCDKGKHLRLTKRPDPSTSHTTLGPLNTAPLNTLAINARREVWMLKSGDRTVDVAALAIRVIQKWDAFFTGNGL